MHKADLHVHSKFSNHPSDWFLQRIGAAEGFLQKLKSRETSTEGRHNDYQGLTFSLYKISYDYIEKKSRGLQSSHFRKLSRYLLEKNRLNLIDRLKIRCLHTRKSSRFMHVCLDLLRNRVTGDAPGIEDKLCRIYNELTHISNRLLRNLLSSIEWDLGHGRILDLLKNVASALPGVFVSVPFISAFQYLGRTSTSSNFLLRDLQKQNPWNSSRILCFADDLSIEVLPHIPPQAVILTVAGNRVPFRREDATVISLPVIYRFERKLHGHHALQVPSPLQTLKKVHAVDPEEIGFHSDAELRVYGGECEARSRRGKRLPCIRTFRGCADLRDPCQARQIC